MTTIAEMAEQRDPLYAATMPVEGTALAWALRIDAKISILEEQIDVLRLRRAEVLAKYTGGDTTP